MSRVKIASFAVALSMAALLGLPSMAFAGNVDQLSAAYTNALQGYEEALDEQEENADEIVIVEQEIAETEKAIVRTQDELGETAVALYKGTNRQSDLMNLVLSSDNFSEAVRRYDLYEKVQRFCADQVDQLVSEKQQLDEDRIQLEERKREIAEKVAAAKRAADAAHQALLDAVHTDGAKYHQVQGNNENCGATSFIVGVNTLLHENRFTDNVKVWSGPGFNGDSTANIVSKGKAWLLANGLADVIEIEDVKGDIHETEELAALLNDGCVVVISSGASSIWQRADGTETEAGAFPDGHYLVFYHYDADGGDIDDSDADGNGATKSDGTGEGIFYCNDSSVDAKKGAGVAYTEEQMQQWLDGRGNHFAVSMYKK